MKAVKKSNQGRRGYALVIFAMMLFGLFAMAALVIDIGFVRLAQRQMQTAADAAALEGLRNEGDASITFAMRQDEATQIIEFTFDDDLNPGNGDDGIAGAGGQFGAGPLVDFSGGVSDPNLAASQLLTIDPNNIAYKPQMQQGLETTGQFRVSLQRGGSLDNSAAIFSRGPAVPLLFARGSLVDRELIRNGITVRASAVAEARPVVRLWQASSLGLSLQPVAFEVSNWGATPTNAVSIVSDISDGLMVGQTIVTGASVTPTNPGYCAIYEAVSNRVIGFGRLGQTNPVTGVVASRNASARLSDAWESLGPLTGNDRAAMLESNRTLTHALMAPVLRSEVN
ncbi:MAG: Tad domain-containing protein [Planctomycetota bacterium]